MALHGGRGVGVRPHPGQQRVVEQPDPQHAGVGADLLGQRAGEGGGGVGVAGGGPGDGVEQAGGVADRAGDDAVDGGAGPRLAEVGAEGGARPGGLEPDQAHSLDGMRIEPPPSEAWAAGTINDATAAALPPDEPPVECSGFHGLRLGPWARGSVVMVVPNSGVLVRPTTTSPASRKRVVRVSSTVGVWSRSFRNDAPACIGSPALRSPRSLSTKGTPRNGPSGSAPSASSRALSKRSWMTALSCGLTASMRSMAASTNSRGEASPRRTSSACPQASSRPRSSSATAASCVGSSTATLLRRCAEAGGSRRGAQRRGSGGGGQVGARRSSQHPDSDRERGPHPGGDGRIELGPCPSVALGHGQVVGSVASLPGPSWRSPRPTPRGRRGPSGEPRSAGPWRCRRFRPDPGRPWRWASASRPPLPENRL